MPKLIVPSLCSPKLKPPPLRFHPCDDPVAGLLHLAAATTPPPTEHLLPGVEGLDGGLFMGLDGLCTDFTGSRAYESIFQCSTWQTLEEYDRVAGAVSESLILLWRAACCRPPTPRGTQQ